MCFDSGSVIFSSVAACPLPGTGPEITAKAPEATCARQKLLLRQGPCIRYQDLIWRFWSRPAKAALTVGRARSRFYRQRRPRLQRPRPSFFFQAEDGIRDLTVTGVQTCALQI